MRRPLRSRSRMFIADYWRLDYGEGHWSIVVFYYYSSLCFK